MKKAAAIKASPPRAENTAIGLDGILTGLPLAPILGADSYIAMAEARQLKCPQRVVPSSPKRVVGEADELETGASTRWTAVNG